MRLHKGARQILPTGPCLPGETALDQVEQVSMTRTMMTTMNSGGAGELQCPDTGLALSDRMTVLQKGTMTSAATNMIDIRKKTS